ncbi:MAG: pseudouridylate synthase [Bacteroidaceae bacterium]|nr:pseudouridylate synthase [Bacteroidaceae bacterium]
MNGFEKIDVHTLLPQQEPFVMIDRLVHYDPVKTVTTLQVRPDNIFADDGHLSVAGLNENIAQTCAARMGYISLSSGDKVKIGVIGAITGFSVNRTPLVGEMLTTEIEVKQEVFQVTLVHATVKAGEEVIAETDLKIALQD